MSIDFIIKVRRKQLVALYLVQLDSRCYWPVSSHFTCHLQLAILPASNLLLQAFP